MNERGKLAEAKYFLQKMQDAKSRGKKDEFRFNLSAFLAAARSVLQYALKEADSKGHRDWYNNIISKSPVLRFLKDERDSNIHQEPVRCNEERNVSLKVTVDLSDSIELFLKDKDGNIKDNYTSPRKVLKPKIKSDVVRSYTRYLFDNWSGKEDVLDLSKTYLAQLEELVKDGISKKYISG